MFSRLSRSIGILATLAALVMATVLTFTPSPASAAYNGIDPSQYRCPDDALALAPVPQAPAEQYRACQQLFGSGNIVVFRSQNSGATWQYHVNLYGTLPANTPLGIMHYNGRTYVWLYSTRSFDYGTSYYKSAPDRFPTNALSWDSNWHPTTLIGQY